MQCVWYFWFWGYIFCPPCPPPSTQATLKTTTPFLLPTTVLPKVEEDADRPRCDSNLVYMPNDRQATFCSYPRFLCTLSLQLIRGLNRFVMQILTTNQSKGQIQTIYSLMLLKYKLCWPLSISF